MADEQQPPPTLSAFPAPPPFYQHFTPENLERITSLRSAQPNAPSKTFDPATSLLARLLDLPPELRNLQPPEPPRDGIYRCFGEILRLENPIISLAEQGLTQLYTPPPTDGDPHSRTYSDVKRVLKRIAKSLLVNFVEMLGILSVNPAQVSSPIYFVLGVLLIVGVVRRESCRSQDTVYEFPSFAERVPTASSPRIADYDDGRSVEALTGREEGN